MCQAFLSVCMYVHGIINQWSDVRGRELITKDYSSDSFFLCPNIFIHLRLLSISCFRTYALEFKTLLRGKKNRPRALQKHVKKIILI